MNPGVSTDVEFNYFFLFVWGICDLKGEGKTDKRLTPDVICVEEMSQHTSCHGNSEEHEAELAAGLHPNIIPVVTRGSPRDLSCCGWAGEGLQLHSSHPAGGKALYSCTSCPWCWSCWRGDRFASLLKNPWLTGGNGTLMCQVHTGEFVP